MVQHRHRQFLPRNPRFLSPKIFLQHPALQQPLDSHPIACTKRPRLRSTSELCLPNHDNFLTGLREGEMSASLPPKPWPQPHASPRIRRYDGLTTTTSLGRQHIEQRGHSLDHGTVASTARHIYIYLVDIKGGSLFLAHGSITNAPRSEQHVPDNIPPPQGSVTNNTCRLLRQQHPTSQRHNGHRRSSPLGWSSGAWAHSPLTSCNHDHSLRLKHTNWIHLGITGSGGHGHGHASSAHVLQQELPIHHDTHHLNDKPTIAAEGAAEPHTSQQGLRAPRFRPASYPLLQRARMQDSSYTLCTRTVSRHTTP